MYFPLAEGFAVRFIWLHLEYYPINYSFTTVYFDLKCLNDHSFFNIFLATEQISSMFIISERVKSFPVSCRLWRSIYSTPSCALVQYYMVSQINLKITDAEVMFKIKLIIQSLFLYTYVVIKIKNFICKSVFRCFLCNSLYNP